MNKIILFSLMLLLSTMTLAAENVLDFEGDVIEGERHRPELFLQLTNDQLDMKELIYIRENFNDYLEYDKKMKPRYFKFKKK